MKPPAQHFPIFADILCEIVTNNIRHLSSVNVPSPMSLRCNWSVKCNNIYTFLTFVQLLIWLFQRGLIVLKPLVYTAHLNWLFWEYSFLHTYILVLFWLLLSVHIFTALLIQGGHLTQLQFAASGLQHNC